jgi:hypothetical protein
VSQSRDLPWRCTLLLPGRPLPSRSLLRKGTLEDDKYD